MRHKQFIIFKSNEYNIRKLKLKIYYPSKVVINLTAVHWNLFNFLPLVFGVFVFVSYRIKIDDKLKCKLSVLVCVIWGGRVWGAEHDRS